MNIPGHLYLDSAHLESRGDVSNESVLLIPSNWFEVYAEQLVVGSINQVKYNEDDYLSISDLATSLTVYLSPIISVQSVALYMDY